MRNFDTSPLYELFRCLVKYRSLHVAPPCPLVQGGRLPTINNSLFSLTGGRAVQSVYFSIVLEQPLPSCLDRWKLILLSFILWAFPI